MQDAEAYYKQEQNIKYVSDSYGKESLTYLMFER